MEYMIYRGSRCADAPNNAHTGVLLATQMTLVHVRYRLPDRSSTPKRHSMHYTNTQTKDGHSNKRRTRTHTHTRCTRSTKDEHSNKRRTHTHHHHACPRPPTTNPIHPTLSPRHTAVYGHAHTIRDDSPFMALPWWAALSRNIRTTSMKQWSAQLPCPGGKKRVRRLRTRHVHASPRRALGSCVPDPHRSHRA